jgi:hypothetical protein
MAKKINETNQNDSNSVSALTEGKNVIPYNDKIDRRNNFLFPKHYKSWLQFNPNTK